MDEQGRRHPVRARFLPLAALLAACLAASGCVGPAAVRSTRMRYNESMRATNDEQLLMNLVRLRYADSPIFIDLPTITSQFELAAGGSDPGPAGSQTNFGIAGLSGRDSPTLSYHPRQGREISKALLNPLSADLYSVVTAGARLEQLLWMTLNDINDVQNAVQGHDPGPPRPRRQLAVPPGRPAARGDRRPGRRGDRVLDDRRHPGAPPTRSPRASSRGRDLLGAAKDGYVYRDKGDGRMTLYKRDKELVLKIRAPFTRSPEMAEMAEIFNLTPGLEPLQDRVRAGARRREQPARARAPGEGHDLPQPEVDPPDHDVHVQGGLRPRGARPQRRGADDPGARRPPVRLDHGHRRQLLRRLAEAPPARRRGGRPYRGYWFYIPEDDVNSRSALAVLEILFSLQESGDVTSGPVLTLPAGR